MLGIQKAGTSPYRPQLDGMVERANQTIENMLSIFVEPYQTDWDKFTSLIMMDYRTSIHASIGVTPCSMMLGREITLPVDLWF